MVPGQKITLTSSEGERFEVSFKAAKLSHTVKELCDNLGIIEPSEDDIIPLPNVSSKELKKICEWLERHQHGPQPTNEQIRDKQSETINPWDSNFLKMGLQELYDLIAAANYMNIPALLWLTTREVAYMMKGKSPEEIRQIFAIENDWTPAELQATIDENRWCEERS